MQHKTAAKDAERPLEDVDSRDTASTSARVSRRALAAPAPDDVTRAGGLGRDDVISGLAATERPPAPEGPSPALPPLGLGRSLPPLTPTRPHSEYPAEVEESALPTQGQLEPVAATPPGHEPSAGKPMAWRWLTGLLVLLVLAAIAYATR